MSWLFWSFPALQVRHLRGYCCPAERGWGRHRKVFARIREHGLPRATRQHLRHQAVGSQRSGTWLTPIDYHYRRHLLLYDFYRVTNDRMNIFFVHHFHERKWEKFKPEFINHLSHCSDYIKTVRYWKVLAYVTVNFEIFRVRLGINWNVLMIWITVVANKIFLTIYFFV